MLKKKICNGIAGETTLYKMPQVKNVFDKSYAELDKMIAFTSAVEDRLNKHLKEGTIPEADLVDAIAVCKIRCIDVAIKRAHALRMEVGSYALMWKTGFELFDMLLCCKFAEGDSRILQMKLTRDRLKKLKKDGMFASALQIFGSDREEALAALSLASKLAPAGRDLVKMQKAMDDNWKEVYALSELIEERHMRTQKGTAFVEPLVERLTPASNTFDDEWKSKI